MLDTCCILCLFFFVFVLTSVEHFILVCTIFICALYWLILFMHFICMLYYFVLVFTFYLHAASARYLLYFVLVFCVRVLTSVDEHFILVFTIFICALY